MTLPQVCVYYLTRRTATGQLQVLPGNDKWDDAKHWHPGVLAGTPAHATFTFGPDLKTVVPNA